jgi:NAD(P)-dependent dehydrogenase (short-subunit alcohol dehydrogenase family)
VFAAEGATLFLAGRRLATVGVVANDVIDAGANAVAAEVDALDEAGVESHVADVIDCAGRIDVLFNAIGISDVQGEPLVDMPVADIVTPVERGVRVNAVTARAVGRRMTAQRAGVLMTVTARPGATPHVGGFAAACGAIEALWRTLAGELGGHGVRTVVLRSVGSPDTGDLREMISAHASATGRTFEEAEAEFAGSTLLGRLPKVREIANAAAVLASDRATAMTATIANVTNGAWHDV